MLNRVILSMKIMCTNQIKGCVSVITIDCINVRNVCLIAEWQLELHVCQEDKLKVLCFYMITHALC